MGQKNFLRESSSRVLKATSSPPVRKKIHAHEETAKFKKLISKIIMAI